MNMTGKPPRKFIIRAFRQGLNSQNNINSFRFGYWSQEFIHLLWVWKEVELLHRVLPRELIIIIGSHLSDGGFDWLEFSDKNKLWCIDEIQRGDIYHLPS